MKITRLTKMIALMNSASVPRYLFRDEFITPRDPGQVNGTPAEPGPGTRTVVDTTNKLSIADGKLVMLNNVSRDPMLYNSYSVSRLPGRAIITQLKINASGSGDIFFTGWTSNPAADSLAMGLLINRTTNALRSYPDNADQPGTFTNGVNYSIVMVLRTLGGFLIANNKLIWISYTNNTSPLYVTYFGRTITYEALINYVRMADLPYPFNDDYGLATQRLAGARTAGDTFSHEADCHIEWTVTTLPSDQQQMAIRKQDDNNYWRVDVNADGSIALQEVVGGTPTSRGTGAAGSIANGKRMVVIADGTTINVYANNVLKITYTSATNFQTATAGKINSLGVGGAVSDIVTWPRYLTGAAAAILERYSR